MTSETRAKLETKLLDHGLTVVLTRDYNATLLQLARLAQFERLVTAAAEHSPLLSITLHPPTVTISAARR